MSRTYSHLLTHIIFSTKDRAPIIVDDLKCELHVYLGRKITFQEEFLDFLRKHQIEYDPRYIWD